MTVTRFQLDDRYHVTVSDKHAAEDEAVVDEGLSAFNRAVVGSEHYTALNLFLRDQNGDIQGGLLGATYWGWCAVNTLWVNEALRGQGFGRRLLQMAIEEALRRGCHGMHLDTLSFQALPFYEKLGFTVFGQIDDYLPGETRYYLKKALNSTGL